MEYAFRTKIAIKKELYKQYYYVIKTNNDELMFDFNLYFHISTNVSQATDIVSYSNFIFTRFRKPYRLWSFVNSHSNLGFLIWVFVENEQKLFNSSNNYSQGNTVGRYQRLQSQSWYHDVIRHLAGSIALLVLVLPLKTLTIVLLFLNKLRVFFVYLVWSGWSAEKSPRKFIYYYLKKGKNKNTETWTALQNLATTMRLRSLSYVYAVIIPCKFEEQELYK